MREKAFFQCSGYRNQAISSWGAFFPIWVALERLPVQTFQFLPYKKRSFLKWGWIGVKSTTFLEPWSVNDLPDPDLSFPFCQFCLLISFINPIQPSLKLTFSLGIYVSAALTFVSRYPDLTSDCGPTGEAENGGFPFDNFVPASGSAFDPESFSILCEESRRNWAEFAGLFRYIHVLLRTKSTRRELWPR